MADEGSSGGKKIARLAKGDKSRTARHAAVMNELIDAINALNNITLLPAGIGKVIYSEGNVVIELNTATCA